MALLIRRIQVAGIMARNPVQLQKGLSLTEFQTQYGTELQCREAVARWRWPNGFECPHCQGGDYLVTKKLDYSCRGCRKVTSLIAGTVYENTLLPLTK
jgi:Transposase zinc-ribbon domain